MTDHLQIESLETARGSFRDGPHTLRVAPGEIVTLVGPNGCGKSTLLETIAGILPARAGSAQRGERVWLRGNESAVPPHERGVGVLLQGLGLWPHRTVEEQVRLVASEGASGCDDDRLARLAEALEIDAKLGATPAELSGGEAQRAALLRALAADSAVLLLDEPTSAQFDDSARRIEAVLEAEASRGKQILIATHRDWPNARRYSWAAPPKKKEGREG